MPPAESNENLLFPNAFPLNINQEVSGSDIVFQTGSGDSRFLSIVIFSSPPRIIDEVVDPTLVPLWRYDGPFNPQTIYRLDEGMFTAGAPALDSEFFLCMDDPLYWAAWAWEETAHFVTHSSRAEAILEGPLLVPDVRLLSARKIGENSGDSLFQTGEAVSLRLTFINQGNTASTGGTVTLRQNDIVGLPQTFPLVDLAPGEEGAVTASFQLPGDAAFGSEISFVVQLNNNVCITTEQEFSLRINSQRVFMVDVRLITINFIPPLVWWDPPPALPSFWPPDIFYRLLSPTGAVLESSSVINDASNSSGSTSYLGDWPDLTPPIELELDSTYLIYFIDEDLSFDDTISSVSILPRNYLANRDTLVLIANEEVDMEFILRWE